MKLSKKGVRNAKWAALAVLAAALIAGFFLLPLEEWVGTLETFIEGLGRWAYVGFVAAYAIGTVVFFPVALLTLVAGMAFGTWVGFLLTMLGAMLGAISAFLLSRHVLRGKIRNKLREHPKLENLDADIEKHGWKYVGLIRLSPIIPFALQNYLFGASKVGFWPFAVASGLAMAPGTLLHVYLGAIGKAYLRGEMTPMQWAMTGTGIVASIALSIFIARRLKAAPPARPSGRSARGPAPRTRPASSPR